MTHETRRTVRSIFTVLHLITQLLLLWYAFAVLGTSEIDAVDVPLTVIRDVLLAICGSLGSFAVYYTLLQMFSGRNQPGARQ